MRVVFAKANTRIPGIGWPWRNFSVFRKVSETRRADQSGQHQTLPKAARRSIMNIVGIHY